MYCLIEVHGDRYRVIQKSQRDDLLALQSTKPLRVVVDEKTLGRGAHHVGEEGEFPRKPH